MSHENINQKVQNYMKRNESIIPESLADEVANKLTKMLQHPAYKNPDYVWTLNDFELGSRLGRGKFGRVFLAKEKSTGIVVALKTLLKKEIVKEHSEHLVLREIEIQKHLKHPNILNLMTWFHDDFRIYLVLEYAAKGEIYRHLKNSPGGHFTEPVSAKYLYQVTKAIDYCHRNQVIHRDIKPENLLLTIDDNVKLADFGWSVHAPSATRKTLCGTLDYLPPEMVKQEEYSFYVDHWCLGILCYEFLAGYPPFESETQTETYERIKRSHVKFPSHLSSGAKSVIQSLLNLKAEERTKLTDLLEHPWIVDNMAKISDTSIFPSA